DGDEGREGRDNGGEDRGESRGESRDEGQPRGGVHAGGGGLAQSSNTLGLGAGAALLLGGLGAGAYMLRRRQASDPSAA
ncbi:hypothetical protein ACWEP4_39810, partial [Streptomyces sp. NPDC004227]